MVVVATEHTEQLDPSVLWRSTVSRPVEIARLISFVETEARPDGSLAGLVDPNSVAVVGHSYGGYSALAAAGAELNLPGLRSIWESAEDEAPVRFLCEALVPRAHDIASLAGNDSLVAGTAALWTGPPIDAVVSLAGDAAMFGEAGLQKVTIPLLAIGGTADTDSPFEWGTEFAFRNVSSERKIKVSLEGAGHMVFTGRCETARRIIRFVNDPFCSERKWDRGRAHALIRHYVASFLLAELKNDSDAAAILSSWNSVKGISVSSIGYEGPTRSN
jgi:predicted dienelactone hydrolase